MTEGASPGTTDERLPRSRRITRGPEIRAVFRRGTRTRSAHLDIFALAAERPHPRAGVVVPLYGHTAVDRNLVKRRLREVLRRDVLPRLRAAGRAVDVLVRARPAAYGARFGDLRDELGGWVDECDAGVG